MGEPVSVSLLSFFVSAASAFGKLLSYFRNLHRQTRDDVAGYFDQIAACLREVAERIETGQPPRDTCRRLAVYAAELKNVLGGDGYLTAAGDASVDETRLRLAGEIERAQSIWDLGAKDADPVDLGARKLTGDLVRNAAFSEIRRTTAEKYKVSLSGELSPPEAEIERFEGQIMRELDERMGGLRDSSVQEIWDAAGGFAALADALRARR
jgi:hypothetical protein